MHKKQAKTSSLHTYKRLLGYVKPFWMFFLLGVIGIMFGSGVDSAFTYLVKSILDKGLIGREQNYITWIPIIIVVMFIARGCANFLANYSLSYVARQVVMVLRQTLFGHYLALPASYYEQTTTGNMLSAIIYNVEQVAKASTNALITIIQQSFLILGLLVVMFINSWQLTLFFFLVGPVVAVIVYVTSRGMRRVSLQIQQVMGRVTSIAEEGIDGYKVIRTFGGQAYETNKFNEATEESRQREMRVVVLNSISVATVQIVAGIAVSIIVYFAMSATISAGTVVSMVAAMLAMLQPIKRLTKVNKDLQKGLAGAESIFEILDREPEVDKGTKTLNRAKGLVEFDNIMFRYPKAEKDVLKGVSLKIEPNQTVALVGRSGSGKSTLASLLPRFYDVTEGDIRLDGENICDYTLKDLRRQLSLVSQNVVLFNDTIANNIAYGCEGSVTRKQIKAAAEAAHAMEFINELPKGLDTLTGENGVLLSGGQRQRLAIARALLKDAPILILDEATSALDTEAERHIQAALAELMENRTTLVIAHRLSTIEHAHNIIVLEDGCILEQGRHQDLLAQGGRYAKLHQSHHGSHVAAGRT